MITFTSAEAARSAAAIRAAADLVEQAGIGGLAVSCHRDRIVIHVGERDGDPQARARTVAAVAGVLGCVPAQTSSGASANAWLEAAGQVSGVRAEVFTPLAVRSAPGGAGSLAAGPGGRIAVIGAGQQLPAGWRWVTELDDPRTVPSDLPQQVP
jgi:hypothetical protein